MYITKLGQERLLKVAEYLENTHLPNFNMMNYRYCVIGELSNIFPEDWKQEVSVIGVKTSIPNCHSQPFDTYEITVSAREYLGISNNITNNGILAGYQTDPKEQAQLIRDRVKNAECCD